MVLKPNSLNPPPETEKKAIAKSISGEVFNNSGKLVSSTPITGAGASSASIETTTNAESLPFPVNITQSIETILGKDGKAYFVVKNEGNTHAIPVDSRKGRNIIRHLGREEGMMLRKRDINDIIDFLQAFAETEGQLKDVWYRVASIPGGIEIDLGDEKHTRVRITPGKVEILKKGSDTLFFRTSVSRPMAMPSDKGDLKLVNKYLNLQAIDVILLIAWISYTLAHPKTKATNFVILVLLGGQGSGKTGLCNNVLQPLVDPNLVGVQLLPNSAKDLAIAAAHSHLLAYDNVRGFRQQMADVMCIASTGGALTARQLYTDADQHVQHLHRVRREVSLRGRHRGSREVRRDQPALCRIGWLGRQRALCGTGRGEQRGDSGLEARSRRCPPLHEFCW